MNQVLINCSNLQGGGAVAIATSFISHISVTPNEINAEISLICSSSVYGNLSDQKIDLSKFKLVIVQDIYGITFRALLIHNLFKNYDLVFTVIGPAYFLFKKARHIFGFAHPWIIYPNNYSFKEMRFYSKIIVRLNSFIRALFLMRADQFVVEHTHVKEALQKIYLLKSIPTAVVHSEVDSIFEKPEKFTPIKIPARNCTYRLGLISRNYAHKNIKILPNVKKKLMEMFGINVEFYVTFTEAEWADCSHDFQSSICNVGPLLHSQCPNFYLQMDAIIMPTFLECFSAVPIEAMVMKKPVFISDLNFIRDVYSSACVYFNPRDAVDIATSIANFFNDPNARRILMDHVDKFIGAYSQHGVRGDSYLKMLKNYLLLHK